MSQRSSKASTQVWEVLDFYNGRHKKENANGLMGVDIAELGVLHPKLQKTKM